MTPAAPSKPCLLIALRMDCARLMLELEKHFTLVAFPGTAKPPIQDYHIPSTTIQGIDIAQFLADNYNGVAAAVATTNRLIDEHKPVGCVLWNTAQPHRRATARACQTRGVPVFEINHWAISTYLIGHFECQPAADFIYGSPEFANFLSHHRFKTVLKPIGRGLDEKPWILQFGRPQYDTWTVTDRLAARRELGLPPEGPVVLVTSTWTHHLTAWSDSEWSFHHQADIMQTLKMVQDQLPQLKVIWTTRFAGTAATWAGRLSSAGLEAQVTDDEPLSKLIAAADFVVTQKSGVIADALVLGRPVICVDYRPQSDSFMWRPYGALHANSFKKLVRYVLMLLKKPRAREIVESGREAARKWFGYVEGGCSAAIAKDIKQRCENFSSPAAPAHSAKPTSSTGTGASASSSSRATSKSTKRSGSSSSRTSG